MDSIHVYSTTHGAKKKGRIPVLKDLFHELRRIFISSYGDTVNAITEEKLTAHPDYFKTSW